MCLRLYNQRVPNDVEQIQGFKVYCLHEIFLSLYLIEAHIQLNQCVEYRVVMCLQQQFISMQGLQEVVREIQPLQSRQGRERDEVLIRVEDWGG